MIVWVGVLAALVGFEPTEFQALLLTALETL